MLNEILLRILKLPFRKYSLAFREFIEQTKNPREMQKNVLMSKLRKNENTAYGRKFGFRYIHSPRDFQKQAPLIVYKDISDYIEKEKNNRDNILTSQKPLRFVTTSGTTDKPKFIPVTEDFLQEYKNSWNIWITSVVASHLKIMLGKALSIVSPSIEGRLDSGIPYGAMTGLSLDYQSWISKAFYALPSRIFSLEKPDIRNYVTLRFALEKKISILSTANPSTIKNICIMADKLKEKLIREIHNGEISVDVSEKEKELINSLPVKPNKKRAAELEKIVEETAHLYPKDYWKNLQIISCWKGGTLSLYLESFREFFRENTPVREIGLVASEGRFSIPLTDKGSSGVLDISSHFYEFIPESEIESRAPTIFLAHELEESKKYFIVPTTSSGLYRYNISDLVEVSGFYNNTPMIRFLNKGKHTSSITGEKLTEYQIVRAMEETCRADNFHANDFLLCPEWSETPRYVLLFEEKELRGKDKIQIIQFAKKFDRNLRKINLEYDSKRKDRLGLVVIGFVQEGTFEKMKIESLGNSKKDVQYKHKFLNPEIDFYKKLNVRFID